MKPYKFSPYLKTTLWGGYQIAPFKGIYTAQPNIGESWEISGVPGHESEAIDRGLIDDVDVGLTLTELIDKYKGLLVGDKVYKKFGNKFPILVKLIDSRQDLSVQVHPDDKLALRRRPYRSAEREVAARDHHRVAPLAEQAVAQPRHHRIPIYCTMHIIVVQYHNVAPFLRHRRASNPAKQQSKKQTPHISINTE